MDATSVIAPGMTRLVAAGSRSTGTGATAMVSARGAALRLLRVAGCDLVEPTVTFAAPPLMAGVVLAPWPNRTADARWILGGAIQRLEVTEPALGHANHGLFADAEFVVRKSSHSSVTLAATVDHPAGYPFTLLLAVRYDLDLDGITVTVTVDNHGPTPAPVAIGAHPYLRLGELDAEALSITVAASRARRPDSRELPGPSFAVDGTDWDLRVGRPVSSIPRHGTWIGAPAGARSTTLAAPGGATAVELWADPSYRWTQLYLAEGLPTDGGTRTALAVEPMTAPPNALRTGEGLLWLKPAGRTTSRWGVRLRHPPQSW